MCAAMIDGYRAGYLQIVDVMDGAKVRLHTEPPATLTPTTGDALFGKKTAKKWYSFIGENSANERYSSPSPSRLFSTTNASFMKDTESDTTRLTFPQMN